MKPSIKIANYFFAALVFGVLKIWYAEVKEEDVLFLLLPINKLVNIVMGSSSYFQSDLGYVNENLNIIINKSCSGFNFLLIVFSMLIFLMVKYFKNFRLQIFIIPIALILSYFFTIVVNVSRILLSVVMNDIFANKTNFLHQFEGTFMYMSCLMSLYLTADYLLKKWKHEKLA